MRQQVVNANLKESLIYCKFVIPANLESGKLNELAPGLRTPSGRFRPGDENFSVSLNSPTRCHSVHGYGDCIAWSRA